jgi:hypothetical protein
MVYLFERESESLRLETRFSKTLNLYEIIWRRADGTLTRETFSGETSFRSRVAAIQTELEREDWHHFGPPHLLADGWKI